MLAELQDSYRNIERIAAGSTSVVYKAVEKKSGRLVAIKEFVYCSSDNDNTSTDLSYIDQWKRFKREIDVHLGLSHENIIEAFDYYEIGTKLFLVMEYFPSVTLQDLLETNTYLDIFEIINIIKQLAVSLQYLHDKGIVHRDLKPSNILITPSKEIKLIDFGCARQIYTDNITSSRMIIGTINYMSPEQLVGYKDIDGRTDIFSLGCTFYQLLSGNLPFKGNDIRDTINNIFQCHPPPVRSLNAAVPFKLEVVVHQTLKKDPDHRCPTAKLLVHYLNKILDEPEIHYKQGKCFEKRGELKKAYTCYKRSIQIDENFSDAWKAIGELYYNASDWENALEYYKYLIRIDSSNHDFYARLGDVYVSTGNNSEALKMYQKAWILKPDEIKYEMKMANGLFLCHKTNEAVESYEAIIERYQDRYEPVFELGIIYYKSGQKKKALSTLERALAYDHLNPDILSCLGSLYQEFGDLINAIASYEQLEIVTPDSPVVLHNLAVAYYQTEQYEAAREKIEKLFSIGVRVAQTYILLGLILEKTDKPEEAVNVYTAAISADPMNIDAYIYLASSLRNQWRLNEAIEVLKKALMVETKYSKAEIYLQLAESYMEKGLINDARTAYQECLSRANPGSIYDEAKRQLKYLLSTERRNRKIISLKESINS